MAKKLAKGVCHRFPNLFRRHATPEEIPILKRLGMRSSYQSGKEAMLLLRVNEVNDLLEGRTEKYEAVPRSQKLLLRFVNHCTLPDNDLMLPTIQLFFVVLRI